MIIKKTIETIPMAAEPLPGEDKKLQKNFKNKMRSSGYTEVEVEKISAMIYQNVSAQVYRYIDLLDYIPCRCGELIAECYPCSLNRMRRDFGADSPGGAPQRYKD